MNLNLTGVILFGVGSVLLYGAVKDRDPRDVVLTALGQKARYTKASGPAQAPPAAGNGGGGGGGGSWLRTGV